MKKILCVVALSAAFCVNLFAKDYEVKMLDVNAEGTMVFEPGFLKIEPGDSVTFIPTHKTHWAKSVVIPAGASKFEGKLDEKFTTKFDVEGVYIYECPPHKIMNMIGIIQVGKPTNLDKVNAAVPKLEKRASENKGRLENYAKQIVK
ncbi:pseudoazurin [Campylobacter sp. MIT 99-7217]|uniref:pseudoazurin n=1 Tax=Campylobacter sp. MIT 99-7217 TaxID=535091 RepID=UPI00115BE85A|nr:pseudoazurin [Campylobacter sp. MIT 99-7217]TQR30973.1 pseudoazurin [Campylobacter sp. MIT 99-7217]